MQSGKQNFIYGFKTSYRHFTIPIDLANLSAYQMSI